MKYLLLAVLLVGCGKNEPIGLLKEDAQNVVEIVKKGVSDVVRESFDAVEKGGEVVGNVVDAGHIAVSQGIEETKAGLTKANDAKDEILSNTGNFTEAIGDLGEGILQAPDKIFNSFVDQEKQDENANNIDQLKEELEELREEMYTITGELFDRMDSADSSIEGLEEGVTEVEESVADLDDKFSRKVRKLGAKIRRVKQQNRTAIRRLRQQVRSKFQRLARATHSEIRDIKRDIRGLESEIEDLEDGIQEVSDELDSLYVSCSYRWWSNYTTGCTLESN